MEGRIKNWISDRGYGFIGVAGQPDVFCHMSGLEPGYDPLRNDVVVFDIDIDPKTGRSRAVNVVRID